MSENIFGLTVAADKGLDDLQCQRLLSENRRYQEVMLQYRCALKALESRLEILNEEFSLQHDRNPIESMKGRLKSPSSIMNKMQKEEPMVVLFLLVHSLYLLVLFSFFLIILAYFFLSLNSQTSFSAQKARYHIRYPALVLNEYMSKNS